MASNFTQSLSANRAGCAGCYLRHFCLSADLNDAETEIFSSHIVSQRRVPKGEILFRAGDPLDTLFITRLGSFKSSVLNENGSEQVTDFHMTGEVLGAEAIPTGYHICTVTALEDSEICSLRYRELEAFCDRDLKIARQFRLLLGRKIVAAHQNLLILGCTNSTQLLASFLPAESCEKVRSPRILKKRIRPENDSRRTRQFLRSQTRNRQQNAHPFR